MEDSRTRGRYHGGRRPSSDDSFHSLTVIPPSALDKPNIMKRYHRRRTCSYTSPRRSPTMVTLHDTRFVGCRWWKDGWTGTSLDGRRPPRYRPQFTLPSVESYQYLQNWYSSSYPCQAPDVIRSVLGLVGLVSAYCDLVRFASLICFFCLSVAARPFIIADPSPRHALLVAGVLSKQQQTFRFW